MLSYRSAASLALLLCLVALATSSTAPDFRPWGIHYLHDKGLTGLPDGGTWNKGMSIGDLNGDGHGDPVLYSGHTGQLMIWWCVWGQTDAEDVCTDGPVFEPLSGFDTTQQATYMAIRVLDFDGDTDNDILVFMMPHIYWIENDGAISDTSPRHVLSSGLNGVIPSSLTVADGSDGLPVVLIGAGFEDHTPDGLLFVSHNGGIHSFVPATYTLSSRNGYWGDPNNKCWPHIFSTTLADFNGDGVDDLLVGCECAGGYANDIFLGNGSPIENGAAFSDQHINTGAGGKKACAGDFNNDGIMDFVSGDNFHIPADSKEYVYYGNGDLTFSPSVQLRVTTQSTMGVICGDFNYDGIDDFILGRVDSALYGSWLEGYTCGPSPAPCEGEYYQNNMLGGLQGGAIQGDFDGDGLIDFFNGKLVNNPFLTEDPSLDIGETVGTLADGTLVKCSNGDCQVQDASGRYVDSDVTTDDLTSFSQPKAGEWTPFGSDGAVASVDADGNLMVKTTDGVTLTYKSCA